MRLKTKLENVVVHSKASLMLLLTGFATFIVFYLACENYSIV